MKVEYVSVAQDLLKEVGAVSLFPRNRFPYPLNQSLFGKPDLEALRRNAKNSTGSQVEEVLPIPVALDKVVEAL